MRKLLQTRLEAAGIAATAEQLDKLCAFHALLTQANARMNLTRVPDDPAEAIDRNYIDSLSPLAHLRGAETCVDVGSGAGFPGVPLSIFLPDTRFVLMDSLAKRVGFLQDAIARLNLNAEAVCLRAEDAGRGAFRAGRALPGNRRGARAWARLGTHAGHFGKDRAHAGKISPAGGHSREKAAVRPRFQRRSEHV